MADTPKNQLTPEFMDRVSTLSSDELIITKGEQVDKKAFGERMNDMSSVKVFIDGKWVSLENKK